ncbi:MAG: hypothetical protein QOH41_2841 [Blastocatellia bacterium]|jgi:hypothetical protein|nr:hypothetical protein [Blastocatellia bacterium]
MTVHAMEEMAEDDLDIIDIEQAILTGQVVRSDKDDPRGVKYVVEGFAADSETSVGVVGRFHGRERYLIVTVYEIGKEQ